MSKQTATHAHPSGSFWARNRKSGGYLLRKTLRRKGYQLIRFLLLFGLCFMIIQPLLDKLSVSFMAERDLYDSTVISIPRHLTTANYSLAASKILLNYGTTFLNTLIVSLAVSVLQIAACTLVGYGFARFEFPFKKFWFAAVIITVIIPPQTISSSLYLHFNFFDIFGIFKATTGSSLNLRGSPIPYALMSATCMGLKNGLYIYMIRQFFTGIPKSLEEAAYVDGCSIFKTFWRVILPDAVPILVSCFLFSFVWQWTDTFYFTEDSSILLRTQTSPMQIHAMETRSLPIRILAPGRVYRKDEVDATHSPMFHQIEGMVIDKGVTMADLKGTLNAVMEELYGKGTVTRFRPHHFPFTEPSCEMDIQCHKCHGAGCPTCKGEGWIEVLGAGMVHPKVLEGCGIDSNVYSGWAFGMGLERLALGHFKIGDLRLIFENDVRFLEQF